MANNTHFDNLIKDSSGIITCASCCASYSIHEKLCPYCGSYNEIGMEKDYLKSLDEIEDNLGEMESYVSDSYINETKKLVKRIMWPVIIIFLISAAFYGLFYYNTEVKYDLEIKQRYAWEEENFPIIDKMYEEGDYEGVLEFMHEAYLSDEKGVSFAFWKHADFMSAYDRYDYLISDLELNLEDYDERFKETEKEITVLCCMYILFEAWDAKLSNGRIDKKEYEMIMEYQNTAREFMKNRFGVTDTDSLKSEVIFDPPGVGVDFSKCDKLSEKLDWVY